MAKLDESVLERIRTEDGSETLNRRDLAATYRSSGGALGESKHVFIDGSGLAHRSGPWRVLELGFGLGTNLDQLIQHAMKHGASVEYLGIEAEPIPTEWAPYDLGNQALIEKLLGGVESHGENSHVSQEHLKAELCPKRWQDIQRPPFGAHAIFHDPFGPATNPDCWGVEMFLWERKHIAPDGIICTYGAAGHVRRAMRDAGFYVAQAPGYGPKREMTLASLTPDVLGNHKIRYRP